MNRYEEVIVALRRIIRATDLHSRKLNRITGLTASQLLILRLLSQNEELTAGEVARQVSLSQATVTTIIDRLEKLDLVNRERGNQDRRRVYIYITEKGRSLLTNAPKPLQASFVQQFQDLHDWEQNLILSALERVAYMMDAQHIDASPVLDIGQLDRNLPEATE